MRCPSVKPLPWAPFALLYLAEGAPIGFLWWALPTWLREQDVPLDRITGLTALLVLPWALKFLWAPLIDRVGPSRGGLRVWIAGFQLLMGLTLLPLIWLDPVEHFNTLRWLVVAHALAASTQDVAIDALALRGVSPEQRGRLNGAMQAGMLVGRTLFGGGALLLAGVWGWTPVILALVGGIWTPALVLPGLTEPRQSPLAPLAPTGLLDNLRTILQRRSTWQMLAFALTAGAAFELTGGVAGPLLVDAGLPASTIGAVIGIPIVLAMLVGGLLGGWMADQSNPLRLTRFGVVLFSSVTLLMAVAVSWEQTPLPLLFALLTAFYLAVGLFTAASYALFMNFSRPPLAATRFSAFMAATNGCEAWAVWCGGRLAAARGYGLALSLMAGVSLLALWILPRRIEASTLQAEAARPPSGGGPVGGTGATQP